MTRRYKTGFFLFHFLNSGLALLIGTAFKLNHHEHADLALGVAMTYQFITFFAFIIHRVRMKQKEEQALRRN